MSTNEFQNTMAALSRAEARLAQLREAGLSLAAKAEEAARAVADDEAAGALDHFGGVPDVEAITVNASAAAERIALRDQLKRYADSLSKEIEAAEREVLACEGRVIQSQRAAYDAASDAALKKLWDAIEKPLRECVVLISGHAYHEAYAHQRTLAGSHVGADFASMAEWNSITPASVVSHAVAGVAADRFTAGFCRDLTIDDDVKGLPPVRAIVSAAVDDARRVRLLTGR